MARSVECHHQVPRELADEIERVAEEANVTKGEVRRRAEATYVELWDAHLIDEDGFPDYEVSAEPSDDEEEDGEEDEDQTGEEEPLDSESDLPELEE